MEWDGMKLKVLLAIGGVVGSITGVVGLEKSM